MTKKLVVQLSGRGTVTLPASVRRELGLEEGAVLTVQVRDGAVVLVPAVLDEIEIYTDERIREFQQAAEMTPDELAEARRTFGLPETPMSW